MLFVSFIHITLSPAHSTLVQYQVIVAWQQELSVVTRLTTRQGSKPCYVQAKSSPPWKRSRQWLSIIFPNWTQNTCLQFAVKTWSSWTGCGHKVSGYKCLIRRPSDEHYYPLRLITLGPFLIHLYKCPLSTLDTPHYSVVHIYTNYLNE